MPAQVERVLRAYPLVYLACHRRHVRDPQSGVTLSPALARLLDHLDSREPTTVVQLARHLGVTPATVSIALDRLSRKGYVRRARDFDDQRRVLLTLTPAGERIAEANSVLEPRVVQSLLARIPVRERQFAIEGLELLARAAEAELDARSTKGDWVRRRSRKKRQTL
jgi:DNA-binding MarR family transcriptional regulator